ncbi:hypothetical protein ES703_116288 [subsurface metagenome]
MVTGSRLRCCKEKRISDNIFRCAVKTVSSEPVLSLEFISKANATSVISVARASSVSNLTVAAICFGSSNSLCTLCCINIAQSKATATSEKFNPLSAQPWAIRLASPEVPGLSGCSCLSTDMLKQPRTLPPLPCESRQTTAAVFLFI